MKPDLAKDLKLQIDGTDTKIFRKLRLTVGSHNVRLTIRGIEVHVETVTVKPPDEEKSIIRVPVLDDPDAKGKVILSFAKLFRPDQTKNLEMFVDGKPHKPFDIPADLKLPLELSPGDHRVSFNYRGIEVLVKPFKVKKPSAGESVESVDPVIVGTIRLSGSRGVRDTETVLVSIDGVEMPRMWKRRDSSWDIEAEVGPHKVRVWMTTPKARSVEDVEIEVRAGVTKVVDVKF